VNPLAGQDEHETLEALLRNVDLSFAWNVLRGCFHASGVDGLQRNLLGVFRRLTNLLQRIIKGQGSALQAEGSHICEEAKGKRSLDSLHG
jgi:hypothetical protein